MISQAGHIAWLGWVVFAIVAGSLLLTILAAVLIRPQRTRAALLVPAAMFTLGVAFVLVLWLAGRVFSAFVP